MFKSSGAHGRMDVSPDQALEWFNLAENALDAMAGFLRAMGQHGFSLGDDDAHTEFEAHCEAWAMHVLTAGPVEAEATCRARAIAQLGPGERAWADLGQFLRQRRQAESRFVEQRVDGFKEVVWELVDGMREISTSATEMHETLDGTLAQLESLAQDGDPDKLRDNLPNIVHTIRDTVSEQRGRYDRRIRSMGVRLDTLRDDLLVARRRIQIDGLTKVYNRGAFDEALQRHVDLALVSQQPLALLMLDLDRFKDVNDTWGHQAGDAVLVNFADCLNRCFLRRSDFVARYGGEEFAVILFDTTQEQAERLAGRVLEQVRDMSIAHEQETIQLTCSIGVTVLTQDDTRERLMARADKALYVAKSAGRDQVAVC